MSALSTSALPSSTCPLASTIMPPLLSSRFSVRFSLYRFLLLHYCRRCRTRVERWRLQFPLRHASLSEGLRAACGAAALATALLSAVLGSERIIWDVVPGVTLTTVLYGLILGRVMIPLVGLLSRRLVPEAYQD